MHVSRAEFYWALGCRDAEAAAEAPHAPGSSRTPDASRRAALLASFPTWPLVATLLDATPCGAVAPQRLCDRAPLRAAALAGAGCVTLLGDALHALEGALEGAPCLMPSLLGQGACSALEGALELAQCVASAASVADGTQGDAMQAEVLGRALRRYEAAGLQRSTAIQTRSALAGSTAGGNEGPPGATGDFLEWLHDYRSPHAELDAALQQRAAA